MKNFLSKNKAIRSFPFRPSFWLQKFGRVLGERHQGCFFGRRIVSADADFPSQPPLAPLMGHWTSNKNVLVVAGFLAVAAFFIFDHISLMAFWLDEAAAANVVASNFFAVWGKASADFQPMFFIYLLKIWSVFLGDSVLALRAFSAFWVLALIVLIYKVGKDFFGSKVAVVVSALASANYFLIWFGGQNRPYTMAAFLSLLSFYFFCKIIGEPKGKYLAGYILATFFGLWTHPWFYFVLGAQILSVFCFGKMSKKILASQVVIVLLSLPNILISLYQSSVGANLWMDTVSLADVFSSFKYLSFGSTAVYVILTAICVVWIELGEEKIYPSVKEKILLFHFFIPIALAFIVSQFTPLYAVGRYEMVVLPFFLTLIALLWSKIDYRILIAVFLLLSVFTWREVANHRELVESYKSDDKTVAAQIIEKAENNDIIITTDLSGPTFTYYIKRQNLGKKITMASFPKELESHPGFKNMGLMLKNKEIYAKEADELSKQIGEDEKIKNVWVINLSSNEINAFLIDSLKKEIKNFEIIYPDLPRQNSWFDEIYLFKKVAL